MGAFNVSLFLFAFVSIGHAQFPPDLLSIPSGVNLAQLNDLLQSKSLAFAGIQAATGGVFNGVQSASKNGLRGLDKNTQNYNENPNKPELQEAISNVPTNIQYPAGDTLNIVLKYAFANLIDIVKAVLSGLVGLIRDGKLSSFFYPFLGALQNVGQRTTQEAGPFGYGLQATIFSRLVPVLGALFGKFGANLQSYVLHSIFDFVGDFSNKRGNGLNYQSNNEIQTLRNSGYQKPLVDNTYYDPNPNDYDFNVNEYFRNY